LVVVTGAGELLNCSKTLNADVFNSVLAGLSQFGIILQGRRMLSYVQTTTAQHKESHREMTYEHCFFLFLLAKIGLVSFEPLTRLYVLRYDQFETFYNEHHRLVESDHRFMHLQGRIYQYGSALQYQLVAAIEFNDLAAPPNDSQLLSGLQVVFVFFFIH